MPIQPGLGKCAYTALGLVYSASHYYEVPVFRDSLMDLCTQGRARHKVSESPPCLPRLPQEARVQG